MRNNERIHRFLKRAGSSDMNVDASSEVKHFDYQVASHCACKVEEIVVIFHGDNLSLSNGINFKVVNSSGSEQFDLLDGSSIKRIEDFALLGDVVSIGSSRVVTFKPARALTLSGGQSLRASINDNMSAVGELKVFMKSYPFDIDI